MYLKQQRYAEAESRFSGSVHRLREERDPFLSQLVRNLAEIYVATGQLTKAAEWQAKLPKEPSPKP